METIKPGQFVELTYDLFVGPENELMERATPEARCDLYSVLNRCFPRSKRKSRI